MSTKNLGRLQRVELRDAWVSESHDFTPWLAEEDNLRLLGEIIGIDLELESQEENVGSFRADILCKDTATEDWVVIENQLERTDHTHLGQLLTYAAGLNAVTIVWIAERFTEEHRAAMDWLNERTDEKINLFGLEIELWTIGDSPIAPKFNIVSQPNDWSRTVQKAASGGPMTEHEQLQLKYWTAFRQYMQDNGSFVKCQKPFPQNWTNHAIGRSGVHLSSIISLRNSGGNAGVPEIRVELVLNGPKAKQEFELLEQQKRDLHTALGFPLTWHNPEGKHMCTLYVRQDADFTKEQLWPPQFEWLREKVETMSKVFTPVVKDLMRPEIE